MAIGNAAAGSSVNASVIFTDEYGDAITYIKLPVTYQVLDFNGNLVIADNAVQDAVNAALFTATFTLPFSAPPTQNGQFYVIKWFMKTPLGATYTSTENFSVIQVGGDETTYYPKDVIVIPGIGFFDRVVLPPGVDPSDPSFSATYKITDENGNTYLTATTAAGSAAPITYKTVGSNIVLTVTFSNAQSQSLPIPTGIQQHYMGTWVIYSNVLDAPEVDSHTVYYITPILQTLMHAIYKMLANGVLANVEPFLTWDAGTMAHHAIKGFEPINQASPKITWFNIGTPLPVGMTHLIEKAGMVSALRAQLNAYASDWDFQGAGVQLNVNRSSTIESMLSQLESDLDKVNDVKRNWLNSGRPVGTNASAAGSRTPMAASQIVLSNSTNWVAEGVPFDGIVPSYLLINSIMIGRGASGKM